jgi:hypothetical protein
MALVGHAERGLDALANPGSAIAGQTYHCGRSLPHPAEPSLPRGSNSGEEVP